MTTARAVPDVPPSRSARRGMWRCVAVQNGEHRFQLSLKIPDRLSAQGLAGLRFEIPRPAVGLDLLAGALDRVFLGVQQVLHEHDELDLAPLVDPVAGPVLRGIEKPELALPIPEHMRLEIGELTHFADREELLYRVRYAHRHCSGLGSRSIKSAIAWRAVLPSKRIAATWRAIGRSTWCRSPSATAVRAVPTPSATDCFPARACSSVLPFPSSTPSE